MTNRIDYLIVLVLAFASNAVVPAFGIGAGSTPAAPAEWVDMLRAIDVREHAIAGRWLNKDGRLECEPLRLPGEYPCISIPTALAGDYDFEITFKRLTGHDAVYLFVPVGNGNVHVAFDSQAADGNWVYSVRDVSRRGRLVTGKEYTARVSVRTDKSKVSATILLDGEEILTGVWLRSEVTLLARPALEQGECAIGVANGTMSVGSIRFRNTSVSSAQHGATKPRVTAPSSKPTSRPTLAGVRPRANQSEAPTLKSAMATRDKARAKQGDAARAFDTARQNAEQSFYKSSAGSAQIQKIMAAQEKLAALGKDELGEVRFVAAKNLLQIRREASKARDLHVIADKGVAEALSVKSQADREVAAAEHVFALANVAALEAAREKAKAEEYAINADPIRRGVRDGRLVIGMSKEQVAQVFSGLSWRGGELLEESVGGFSKYRWEVKVPVSVLDDGPGWLRGPYAVVCTFQRDALVSFYKSGDVDSPSFGR